MDIGAWLRGLGLEQYEEAFRDSAIDGEILPKLTAGELKDVGVTVVGHRRRLLEAIAVLCETESARPRSRARTGRRDHLFCTLPPRQRMLSVGSLP